MLVASAAGIEMENVGEILRPGVDRARWPIPCHMTQFVADKTFPVGGPLTTITMWPAKTPKSSLSGAAIGHFSLFPS